MLGPRSSVLEQGASSLGSGAYSAVPKEGFEELEVYRRAAALADELRAVVLTWESVDQWTLGVQAIRAADSICGNIAEASGRWSHPDQIRVLFIARGSATELQNWLLRARARNLPCPPNASSRVERIGRMLNGLIRRLPRHRE